MENLENQSSISELKSSKTAKRAKFALLIFFLAALIFKFGFWFGTESVIKETKSAENTEEISYGEITNKEKVPAFLTDDVDFGLLEKVWTAINKKYVDAPIPETQLFYGAVAGSVASLGDPYSVFLEPEISNEFQEELKGRFEGIGAEIAIKKEQLTIVAPLSDSPAEKAGLKAGDKVFKIDDLETIGISLSTAVDKIRGPRGTKVVLSVMRENNGAELLDIEIIRDEINFKSVKWEMKDNNIGYIKISHFNEDTSRIFKQAADDILSSAAGSRPSAIILDMRNNPGGYLDKAIDVASWWVDYDSVVIEQFGENYKDSTLLNDKKRIYNSTLEPKFNGIKTVVLVNRGSASGSEIVAGALQDYGLATLVGEKTFGKGSVQELEEFGNGASIKITVAKWLTPNGRTIDKEGIKPDVEVELTEDDYNNDVDPQMDKALEILNQK